MKEFEYKIMCNLSTSDLNKLGASGWELVAVVKNSENNIELYFKREIE